MPAVQGPPEAYAMLLQSVASSCPPFVHSDGQPSLPLSTWFTAFSSSLVLYQVGQVVDLTDWQENRLLLDLLGSQGRQRLDLHRYVAQCQANTTPHTAFLQMVCLRLRDPVTCSNPTEPSVTSTCTGKPRRTGVISSMSKGHSRGHRKQSLKGNKGDKGLWARARVVLWGATSPMDTCVWGYLYGVCFVIGVVTMRVFVN